ncbi:hypothetical protein, partial [Pseudomonas paraeruginosa]
GLGDVYKRQLQATWRQWCRSHAPAGTALRAVPLPGAGR